MRRASILAAVVAVPVVAFVGVASAAVITCTGGRCEGTPQSDGITGTDVRDGIFALNGYDEVFARAGQDELNGGNLGDTLGARTVATLTSAAAAPTSSRSPQLSAASSPPYGQRRDERRSWPRPN